MEFLSICDCGAELELLSGIRRAGRINLMVNNLQQKKHVPRKTEVHAFFIQLTEHLLVVAFVVAYRIEQFIGSVYGFLNSCLRIAFAT